jgi:hypothetical protein
MTVDRILNLQSADRQKTFYGSLKAYGDIFQDQPGGKYKDGLFTTQINYNYSDVSETISYLDDTKSTALNLQASGQILR